mmetsp:Transcript_21572/g.45515  ORF Transcript_21572/g.45515 Transcript_21572/m.45515 type:complete len:206 (+) Transcript_21572:1290-1907(+)
MGLPSSQFAIASWTKGCQGSVQALRTSRSNPFPVLAHPKASLPRRGTAVPLMTSMVMLLFPDQGSFPIQSFPKRSPKNGTPEESKTSKTNKRGTTIAQTRQVARGHHFLTPVAGSPPSPRSLAACSASRWFCRSRERTTSREAASSRSRSPMAWAYSASSSSCWILRATASSSSVIGSVLPLLFLLLLLLRLLALRSLYIGTDES